MNVTTKLLLPADAVVAPVASFPPELSRDIEHEPDDFLVMPANAGPESMVVDADTAALLQYFRSPSTIVDAVAVFCRARNLDPQRTLNDAFATLTDLVAAGALLPADLLAIPGMNVSTAARITGASASAVTRWAARARHGSTSCS